MVVNHSRVTVVIPSIAPHAKTLESVPDAVEALVVTEGNRSEARNRGARLARGETIVFCDDDISFRAELFWKCIESKRDREILGLEDYDFGLLLTRFMLISKSDFFAIGAFDESLNHMEDTDFCIRAKAAGYSLSPIPRGSVLHIEHKGRIGKMERRIYYLRLLKKHKVAFLRLLLLMFRRKYLHAL
jgi:GT2 family glycosyltransferase